MSAIVVGNSPAEAKREHDDYGIDPADWMPLGVRVKVAKEINRLWEEFVDEMHDGPTTAPGVADKFWKYVLAGG